MKTPFSISFAADQHYVTPQSAGVPVWEAAKQVQVGPLRLVNFYAFNNSGAVVYVVIYDSADAGATINRMVVYTVDPNSYFSQAIHGGDQFVKGLYVAAFTSAALSSSAGAIMLYKADWMAAV